MNLNSDIYMKLKIVLILGLAIFPFGAYQMTSSYLDGVKRGDRDSWMVLCIAFICVSAFIACLIRLKRDYGWFGGEK